MMIESDKMLTFLLVCALVPFATGKISKGGTFENTILEDDNRPSINSSHGEVSRSTESGTGGSVTTPLPPLQSDLIANDEPFENYTVIFELLEESSPFLELEEKLMKHEKILEEVDTKYGFLVLDEEMQWCSKEFQRMEKMAMESSSLSRFCFRHLNRGNMTLFKDKERITSSVMGKMKALAILCGDQFRQGIRKNIFYLFHTFFTSLKCILARSVETLYWLMAQNYFTMMVQEIELLTKETANLIELHGKFAEEQNEEKQALLENYRTELNLILEEMKSHDWKEKAEEFEETVKKMPNFDEGRNDWHQLNKLDKYLVDSVYTRFLEVKEKPHDTKNSDNLYVIVKARRRMKQALKEVSEVVWKTKGVVKKMTEQKMRTPVKLFKETSQTFGNLCVNTPKNRVGSCTEANHEVCGKTENNPMYQSSFFPVKKCQCGEQPHCSTYLQKSKRKNIKGNANCRLYPNPFGICRGALGYPCKAFPLAPGAYHESCFSGFCDMEKGRCDSDPTLEELLGKGKRMKKKKKPSFKWASEIRHIFD